MNFHPVEIFPRDINCRKRNHSGFMLLRLRVWVAKVHRLKRCDTSDY